MHQNKTTHAKKEKEPTCDITEGEGQEWRGWSTQRKLHNDEERVGSSYNPQKAKNGAEKIQELRKKKRGRVRELEDPFATGKTSSQVKKGQTEEGLSKRQGNQSRDKRREVRPVRHTTPSGKNRRPPIPSGFPRLESRD